MSPYVIPHETLPGATPSISSPHAAPDDFDLGLSSTPGVGDKVYDYDRERGIGNPSYVIDAARWVDTIGRVTSKAKEWADAAALQPNPSPSARGDWMTTKVFGGTPALVWEPIPEDGADATATLRRLGRTAGKAAAGTDLAAVDAHLAAVDASDALKAALTDARFSDARVERGTLNMADYATGSGLLEDTGLQAAFTTAALSNKRLVLERGKTYVHGSPLAIPSACRIEWNGAALQKAPGYSSSSYGLTVSGADVEMTGAGTYDGNKAGGATGGGITWTGARGAAANVTSKNHATQGWLVSGSVELRCDQLAAEGNGNAGFFVNNGAVLKCDTRCRTKQNTNYGVWVDATAGGSQRIDFATKNEHVGVSLRGGSGWARTLADTNRDRALTVVAVTDWEIEEVVGENIGDPRAGSGSYYSHDGSVCVVIGSTNIRVNRVSAQDCTGYTAAVTSLNNTVVGNGSSHVHFGEVVGVTAYPNDTDPVLSVTGGSKFITVKHLVTDGCGGVIIGESYDTGGGVFAPYPDRTNQHIQIDSYDAFRTLGGIVLVDGGSHIRIRDVEARDCYLIAPGGTGSPSKALVEFQTTDTYDVKVGPYRHQSTSAATGYPTMLAYADANATRCEVDLVGWPGSAVDANGGNQFNITPFNPIVLFNAEATETWTASGATITDDAAPGHYIAGGSGKKIVPTVAAGSYGLGRYALGSAVDLSAMGDGDMISMYVYIPPTVFSDMPASNPMQLRLNTTAVTAYFGVSVAASELVSGGQYLNVRKGRFTAQAGSPSWSSIASTDVLIKAGAGGTFNVTVDAGGAHFKPPVAAMNDSTRTDARRWIGKRRLSGGYHTVDGTVTTGTMVNNRLYAWPLFTAEAFTAVEIGLEVTTIGAGTGGAGTVVIRLGLYNNVDGKLFPGALLLDAGPIDATSATYQPKVISQLLGWDPYNPPWVVAVVQGANTTNPITRAVQSNVVGIAGQASSQSNTNWSSYYQDSVSGALPGTWAVGLQTIGNAPRVMLKAA